MDIESHELDELAKDLLDLAIKTKKTETGKFIKNEAKKLAKEKKTEFTKANAVVEDQLLNSEIKKSFKPGKPFKKDGDLNCRAYSSHPLGHLLDQGHFHKGGKNKDGAVTFVPGYHFMDKAAKNFESDFYQDTEKFVDKLLDKHNL